MSRRGQIPEQEVQAAASLVTKTVKTVLEFLGALYAMGIAAMVGIRLGDPVGVPRIFASVGGWILLTFIVTIVIIRTGNTVNRLQREGRAPEAERLREGMERCFRLTCRVLGVIFVIHLATRYL